MATLQTTHATLTAQLKAAKPGDTLVLYAGPWGDGWFGNLTFVPAINIVSADPANPAVFRSVDIGSSTGLHFAAVNVAFTPDAKTMSFTAAWRVQSSKDIVIDRCKIVGAPSVNGIPENATLDQQNADTTGNVIGRPCGYGVYFYSCQDCAVTNCEVSQFDRGIVLSAIQRVLIQYSHVHDVRHTSIVGSDLVDLTVDGNTVGSSNPWNWATVSGVPGQHDHADCMAFWSATGQTHPNARLKLTNNRMQQLSGANILGAWWGGNDDGLSDFTDIEVSGNTIIVPNLQGLMGSNTVGGRIARNTLIQAQIPSADPKGLPTILFLENMRGITLADNQVSAPISYKVAGLNTETGTQLLTGVYAPPAVAVSAGPDPQIAVLTAQLAAVKASFAADEAKLAAARAALS